MQNQNVSASSGYEIGLKAMQGSEDGSAPPVFLMCPPELYDVDYVINPWMEGNLHASSRERAAEQWEQLYRELARVARVELIEPAAGWPDMVFTANAGLVHGRSAVLSSFFHPERQGEEPHFGRWLRDAGYTVLELGRETPFEGEGDALFAQDGSRLWVGHGPRTAVASHAAVAAAWGVEVVGLHLVDPRFYHLDTCFAPLADGSVLFYPGAFDAESITRIEAFYPPEQRVAVAEADAMRFACNAVNVGRTILMNTVSSDLRARLTLRGFEVVEIPLDEFLKAGGAAKCLVLRLHPEMHPIAAGKATADPALVEAGAFLPVPEAAAGVSLAAVNLAHIASAASARTAEAL